MSVLRKELEKLGMLMMRRFWKSGDYQGAFKVGKGTASRIFILLAVIAKVLRGSMRQTGVSCAIGLLLIDFEQFFDTLRLERLYKKMKLAGIPDAIISFWRALISKHFVRVVFGRERGARIPVFVGVPQGSSWSTELSALYVEIDGVAQRLFEVERGVVQLVRDVFVHLLMYADDLISPNTLEAGLQEQFEAVEAAAEENGLRISYNKSEVVVFRVGDAVGSGKWRISGRRGVLVESDDQWVKYLGFFVEAAGYQKQLDEMAKRGDSATAVLMGMLAPLPDMNLTMRCELFVAKVRSVTSGGSEIWGWTRPATMEKADARMLRVMVRVCRRLENEALCWLLRLLQPWCVYAIMSIYFSLLHY